ncbi:MAG: TlpA family protein disulfide reductase [Bacteroidales bacterium]|nr:TlpA family protein disulfide reductase [Bacteroidales bacterium]
MKIQISKILAIIIVCCPCFVLAQRITVSGKISGGNQESILVCFNNARLDYENFAVDKYNQFSFSFTPKKLYNFIQIEYSDEIVLQPGDSVFISVQEKHIVDISGNNVTLNKSLLEVQQKKSEIWESIQNNTFIDFFNKVDLWYNKNLEQIRACKYVNGNVDRDIVLAYLNFEAAALSYAYLNVMSVRDTNQYAKAINSKEFMQFTEMKNFYDTIIYQAIPYSSALNFYLRFQMNTAFDDNKSYMLNLWDKIEALNLPKPNNDVAYCLLNRNFFNRGYNESYDSFFQDVDTLLNYFDIHANEKENAAFLREEFERNFGYLRPGRQIKDIELTDTLGNKHLLSEFKNKIIYVKMWNITCGPCIQAIPEYNELLTTFTDTNVVFMAVSKDREKYTEQWKSIIRKHNQKGLNFISEKGLNLGIHGFPRYYIIGKGNTIVSLNAPRPNSPKLKAMLEELIKKEQNKKL